MILNSDLLDDLINISDGDVDKMDKIIKGEDDDDKKDEKK